MSRTSDTEVLKARLDHLEEIIKLHDRIQTTKLAAQKEAVQVAAAVAERANSKADAAMEKRFDSVNEFRNTLKDQTGTFPTRAELWGYLLGVVGIVAAVAAYFK